MEDDNLDDLKVYNQCGYYHSLIAMMIHNENMTEVLKKPIC